MALLVVILSEAKNPARASAQRMFALNRILA
jgi:hypothetical protein